MQCFQIDVLNNTMGERVIICSIAKTHHSVDEQHLLCERILLPILYEVFSEPFQVEKILDKKQPFAHLQISFRSAVRYELEYDIYSKAKDSWISGDTHAVFEFTRALLPLCYQMVWDKIEKHKGKVDV